MAQQSFIRGTFVLSAAAFVNRILGFVSGMFLARILGAEGIGLLMMAHPLVPLVITVTELGLPVAISKFVAEADVKGDQTRIKRILFISVLVTGTLSVILTAVSLLGAEWIASILLTDQRAYYAMLAITPIAPIVAVSAVLKGYFRGKQRMTTIAFSDILDNTVQLACVLALVHLLMPYGIAYAAAGAMLASVAGEATQLLFLSASYKAFREKGIVGESFADRLRHGKSTLRELLQMGLPTTGHGVIHSIYGAFQPMLITKSLALAGIGTALATQQFGMLAGYAFPLLFLPSFVTHSLSTALIPAISEANANKNGLLMHERMDQAMRLALLIGAPSTVILFEWATPLTTLIYNSPEAGPLLKILAPMFFLHYFDAPLHAILLGLGKANASMWNYIVATAFKALALFVLGSEFGIVGIAYGLGIGMIILTMLNFMSISSVIGFYMDIRKYVKVGICMVLMGITGQLLYASLIESGFTMLWAMVGSMAAALAVYFGALALSDTVGPRQIRNLALTIGARLR
ncbi:stage V sporulation protein B [Paenibacillus antri]|uniref:Stage V sporulation protein B n=1 Tax=Paenibacillus antri TaxID=2582848 RepID=A0A5R9GJ48_9BACL|nr:stage V sporulation protein B [Paenibacillus antri]TLS52893.1 stage V sporulation protein B [Paenibacillus antri]